MKFYITGFSTHFQPSKSSINSQLVEYYIERKPLACTLQAYTGPQTQRTLFGVPHHEVETNDVEYLINCELNGRTLASRQAYSSCCRKSHLFCKSRITIYQVPYGINFGVILIALYVIILPIYKHYYFLFYYGGGKTPPNHAASISHPGATGFLLNYNAKDNPWNNQDDTPLYDMILLDRKLVKTKGVLQVQTINIILEAGAGCEIKNIDG